MGILTWIYGNSRRTSPSAKSVAADAAGENRFVRGSNDSVPVGFMPYSAADFMERFGVANVVAERIAADYAEVLAFDKTSGFGAQLRSSPRDGSAVATLCAGRYDAPVQVVAAVRLYFQFVAIARERQTQARILNVTKAEWMDSNAVVPPCHPGFDGKKFDPRKGISIKGRYILPGVTFGCKCLSRPIFELK